MQKGFYDEDIMLKKKDEYLEKLDKIPAVSFNREQKQIAKSIIENTPPRI